MHPRKNINRKKKINAKIVRNANWRLLQMVKDPYEDPEVNVLLAKFKDVSHIGEFFSGIKLLRSKIMQRYNYSYGTTG
jgi:hypothetical protein